MLNESKIHLRILTWNLGFGSGKNDFERDTLKRFYRIIQTVRAIDPDIVVFQEAANQDYSNGTEPFEFIGRWKDTDDAFSMGYFQPSLSLGVLNNFPGGKFESLQRYSQVIKQEQGLVMLIRNARGWYLKNLYSDAPNDVKAVEIQRAMPHSLYMGSHQESIAGRDEEDRPILWMRIGRKGLPDLYKVFVAGLHFPTLSGEEQGIPAGHFTPSQLNILENYLSLPTTEKAGLTVDNLGAALRLSMLKQLVFQALRLDEYWKSKASENECLFFFTGDFNFLHTNERYLVKSDEQHFLENNGFECIKKNGFTRKENWKLHDNIWVQMPPSSAQNKEKLSVKYAELNAFGAKEPITSWPKDLDKISDHYPVAAAVE